MKTTKVFKTGNSVAVRLPKALGVKEGTEMRVREEQGKYVLEPVKEEPPEKKIDLTGIYGSVPGLALIERDGEDYEDIPREWHLLGLKPH
jgi:antitoxin VapB